MFQVSSFQAPSSNTAMVWGGHGEPLACARKRGNDLKQKVSGGGGGEGRGGERGKNKLKHNVLRRF